MDKSFCIQTAEDGIKRLNTDHQYYYQMQCQTFSCKKEFCDFIVWTEKDIHIECIEPDSVFWENTSALAKSFFEDKLLPELAGKFYSHSAKNVPVQGSTDKKASVLKQTNTHILSSSNISATNEETVHL